MKCILIVVWFFTKEKHMSEHIDEKKWRCTIVVKANEVYVEYCRTDILCEPIRMRIGTPVIPYAYEVIPYLGCCSNLEIDNAPEFIIERVRAFLKQHAVYEKVSRV